MEEDISICVANEPASLEHYFGRWHEPVEAAVEACSFWPAFVDTVEPRVQRIALVHPQRVKAIASAKLKNDRVDSATLAHLLRTNLLPEAWVADRATCQLRQLVRLRVDLGRERTRWKNCVHAVLHQNGLRPPSLPSVRPAGANLVGPAAAAPRGPGGCRYVPGADRPTAAAHTEPGRERAHLGSGPPGCALAGHIPGIGPYSALVVLAEIGDVRRFPSKRQLYSFAGLVPTKSGNRRSGPGGVGSPAADRPGCA